MKINQWFTLLIFPLSLLACNATIPKAEKKTEYEQEVIQEKTPTKAELIVSGCVRAHGGELYENAHYSFLFRDRIYSFNNHGTNYEYTMNGELKGEMVCDTLVNSEFTRSVNGVKVELNEKQRLSYSESLNSVIYFATLPHKLLDNAVNKTYVGKDSIMELHYEVIKITFNQDGGGTDHDDEYYYWINSENKMIDFLAYNYTVNKGGVRFRSAYNRRAVGGITFQDYINFKAEEGTPLGELLMLYKAGKLEELSRIETEQVQNLNE